MSALATWLEDRARIRRARGLVREDRVHPGGALDLASNDYLGLSRDDRVLAAAHGALDRFGAGARASRLVTGTTAVHRELEHELCALTGAESALVFSSGYAANTGLLAALGDPGTLLITDAHVHASVVDGARLSRSPVTVVAHQDVAAVRAALAGRTQPRAVVVVESVYSVLGDAAPLAELAAACREHDALLVVDEAHGLGVLGAGRGAVHAAGLAEDEHVVVTATLSKALGAQGGAVLGPEPLREHLLNTARSFVFDTGLAPAAAAAAAAACRILAAEPERPAAVHRSARTIAGTLGVPVSAGAVQSAPMPSAAAAAAAAQELRGRGVLVGCFRPPSVPDGVSRLRLTARAGLDPAALDAALAHVAEVLS
ncbi:aminotransferase class I/II-fold pyridoxal phosphate-dependent enzyme [Kocuria sp. M1R5S2]|uniref:aminotransferase class I/II-fold pyridoxal phosphate-dependent enzyme n=1 Tax=Kocuria rhizosphaerae TaxID=3376285 RepID=UPI003798D9E4